MTKSKNIVIIDSEEFIRQLLGEYIEDLGYAVKTFTRVSEGLETISAGDVEVVLIDTGSTSERNYLEAVDRIRKARPELKVVLITGYPTLDGIINAVRSGVYDIVVKPFRLEDIKEILSRVCRPSIEFEAAAQMRGRIRLLEELLRENGIKIPGEKITLKSPADGRVDSLHPPDDQGEKVPTISLEDLIND